MQCAEELGELGKELLPRKQSEREAGVPTGLTKKET